MPIAVVQGNIPQAVKWDAAFKAETLRIYGELTRAAAPGSRLVVWPEAAVPAYVRFEPGALRWLTELAAAWASRFSSACPTRRPTAAGCAT